MDKKRVEIIAVGVVFGLLGLALLYNFALAPSARAGRKARGAESSRETLGSPKSYREELLRTELLEKRLPQQRKELEEKQKKLDADTSGMPRELDHTWLSRQINSIAAKMQITDVSQRLQPSAPATLRLDADLKGKFAERTWEIRMRCGYHELGRFLGKLEGNNPFLEITDITIEGNGSELQNVTLLVHYVVKKEPAADAPPAATPAPAATPGAA